MTDIEALRALCTEKRKLADAAIAEWETANSNHIAAYGKAKLDELAAMGVEINKTPVKVYRKCGGSDRAEYQGTFLVKGVSRDTGDFVFAKIKKDGTPSLAPSGLYGRNYIIEPVLK